MSIYLVRYTPLEPYFFGNEKTFGYGSVKNKTYYVESSELPSQSGLFGTLRYCCISGSRKNYEIDPEEIGSESFNIQSSCMQMFATALRKEEIGACLWTINVKMVYRADLCRLPARTEEGCI